MIRSFFIVISQAASVRRCPTSTGTKTFLIFPDLDLRLKPLLLEAAMPRTALSALQRFVDGEFGIQYRVGP
jgi:hypothetical protein